MYAIEVEYEFEANEQEALIYLNDRETASRVFRALVGAPRIKRLLMTQHGTVDGVPNAWVVGSWVAA